MSTCTEHGMLNMLHHSSIFYQLAQARPHNVLHFLVNLTYEVSAYKPTPENMQHFKRTSKHGISMIMSSQ